MDVHTGVQERARVTGLGVLLDGAGQLGKEATELRVQAERLVVTIVGLVPRCGLYSCPATSTFTS
jgi:hypothetical protein